MGHVGWDGTESAYGRESCCPSRPHVPWDMQDGMGLNQPMAGSPAVHPVRMYHGTMWDRMGLNQPTTYYGRESCWPSRLHVPRYMWDGIGLNQPTAYYGRESCCPFCPHIPWDMWDMYQPGLSFSRIQCITIAALEINLLVSRLVFLV